jgi:cobalt-zinc-cadmium efflux system protein
VRGENLNTRGAWLHVLADTLGSVQAIVAGALILAFGWTWLDPVASVLIALLVLYSSWSLIRQSVMVLMEGAPGDVDVDAVRDRLRRVPGVRAVHDLHVWTISSDLVALSAHVEAHRPPDDVLRALRRDLEAEFGIRHTTIEFDPAEPDDRTLQPCK